MIVGIIMYCYMVMSVVANTTTSLITLRVPGRVASDSSGRHLRDIRVTKLLNIDPDTHFTVPQIFINNVSIGGYSDIKHKNLEEILSAAS